ncbi:DUF5928 domain-containing protein [Litoreibacter roseus]|uniref:Peptide O-xylosyltransferase n=1 Tax=Litoreibacter roseus TaxID=2601869 RepID=A0A6N6JAK1_9RHOB|nr:DUF5928 domain-containing protein [Litoreibacter roseus]GFE63064.1 glycosyl transferase [Litoreibacter roseus]
MAKIAFILLCHKDPKAIVDQAQRLTAAGDYISIHFDARANKDAYAEIQEALAGNASVTFVRNRVRCGWGAWSLVEASLRAVEAAVEAFPRATHFYMLSGDCMPIKSAAYAHTFLDETDVDYIESFDFFSSNWIKTGLKEDRLVYRHVFNERQNPSLFYGALEVQKKLGLRRAIPEDLQIMIGSQWWCLRRRTVEWILEFAKSRRDVMRFFKTTWIPDETFFQTMVRHLVPDSEIEGRTLTFLMFSDYGMPVTFYNDHYDLLLSQKFLFARKISPQAADLKTRLGELYVSGREDFRISDEGQSLFQFLTTRGRRGLRFAPRIWEDQAQIGRERTLLVLTCKKWHVAKRLADRIINETHVNGLEYIFDEEDTELPELGGIETSLTKRTRHNRALLRLIFDSYQTSKLLICVDPSNIEVLRDFARDRAEIHILEIECDFSDAYLLGHAQRIGLARENTPPEVVNGIIAPIRQTFEDEIATIRDEGFAHLMRIGETRSASENATALARFLNIELDAARNILDIDYLFFE